VKAGPGKIKAEYYPEMAAKSPSAVINQTHKKMYACTCIFIFDTYIRYTVVKYRIISIELDRSNIIFRG
jgi:hypothetical protein